MKTRGNFTASELLKYSGLLDKYDWLEEAIDDLEKQASAAVSELDDERAYSEQLHEQLSFARDCLTEIIRVIRMQDVEAVSFKALARKIIVTIEESMVEL